MCMLRKGVLADFRRFTPMFVSQDVAQNFRVDFPGPLGGFSQFDQNIEKLDLGTVFAPRECFFAFLTFFSSIWPNFG